jgi:excisionase family DNA binding protein
MSPSQSHVRTNYPDAKTRRNTFYMSMGFVPCPPCLPPRSGGAQAHPTRTPDLPACHLAPFVLFVYAGCERLGGGVTIMVKAAASSDVRTYVPDERQDAQILDFIRALDAAGRAAPEHRPALVGASGERLELPESMYAVLRQVADALASGMGVTVAPMNAMLTTQEAADFLGIARPTLVRILEHGDIPMEKPNRHRFVRLKDLVEYQAKRRDETRAVLDQMVADAEEDDLYKRTDGPAPTTR